MGNSAVVGCNTNGACRSEPKRATNQRRKLALRYLYNWAQLQRQRQQPSAGGVTHVQTAAAAAKASRAKRQLEFACAGKGAQAGQQQLQLPRQLQQPRLCSTAKAWRDDKSARSHLAGAARSCERGAHVLVLLFLFCAHVRLMCAEKSACIGETRLPGARTNAHGALTLLAQTDAQTHGQASRAAWLAGWLARLCVQRYRWLIARRSRCCFPPLGALCAGCLTAHLADRRPSRARPG